MLSKLKCLNQERFEHLRSLAPPEAIKAMLAGEFGLGDESAIVEAIRKDKRITLSDNEILDFLRDAMMEDDCDAQQCLDELVLRSRASN
jgi:hypothetical protein